MACCHKKVQTTSKNKWAFIICVPLRYCWYLLIMLVTCSCSSGLGFHSKSLQLATSRQNKIMIRRIKKRWLRAFFKKKHFYTMIFYYFFQIRYFLFKIYIKCHLATRRQVDIPCCWLLAKACTLYLYQRLTCAYHMVLKTAQFWCGLAHFIDYHSNFHFRSILNCVRLKSHLLLWEDVK